MKTINKIGALALIGALLISRSSGAFNLGQELDHFFGGNHGGSEERAYQQLAIEEFKL